MITVGTMEDIRNNHQSPLVWSSMQHLVHGVRIILRNVVDQLKTTQKTLGNDLKPAGSTVTKNIFDNMLQSFESSCRNHKVTLDQEINRPNLSFSVNIRMIKRRLGRTCCGHIKLKPSSVGMNINTVFRGREMLNMTQRTPSPQWSTEVETETVETVSTEPHSALDQITYFPHCRFTGRDIH